MLTSKRDNLTFNVNVCDVILNFPRKGIQPDPLVFSRTRGRRAFSSLMEINGIKLNIWGKMEQELFFSKC